MKRNRTIKVLSTILIVVCIFIGFAGCNFNRSASLMLDFLADNLALSLLGDDAFNWNVLSVDPERSYGVKLEDNPKWYSFSSISEDDINNTYSALNAYKQYLQAIPVSGLTAKEMITYRSINDTLNTYLAYYGSPHASDFILIGGSYINSEGGYVAEFANAAENYTFRTKSDVQNLLSMFISTEYAFSTYLNYASARVSAGYPLYDCTISAMQQYLDNILQLGDNYYLYSFIENKIDGAEFLSETEKAEFKISYNDAITENFMKGVRSLSNGLDAYKGHIVNTEQSYLAAYGQTGREYFEWCFENKTGIRNANLTEIYNSLVNVYSTNRNNMQLVIDSVNELKDTDKATYDEFYQYLNGEKVYLDLTDPVEIINYLKEAAQNIVPSLSTEPQINFKYLDSTVEQISQILAYYLLSPLDDTTSSESITLNGYQLAQNPSDTLTTIAHEGYPGHLYAHVREKEIGVKLITTLNSSSAFSEGWAMYVELAVLDFIKSETDNRALKFYCEYNSYEIVSSYLNAVLFDMQINYFGNNVSYYTNSGTAEENAVELIQSFMEIPSVYISYGFGIYYMLELHDLAKDRLGDAYNEIEFNGILLSEGSGPTLTRARELAVEYIASKLYA